MIEAPWLTGEKRGLVTLLLSSHQRAFDRPLMACDRSRQSKRLACQELFACGFPVLAHGTGSDPLITYANSQLCTSGACAGSSSSACPHA